jgi:hypothetical protein
MGQKRSHHRFVWKVALTAMLVATLSIPAHVAFAQGGIQQHQMLIDAGGGGTVSGGDFSLSSSIAQPTAGMQSGGDFTLINGFWTPLGLGPTGGEPEKFLLTLPFVLQQPGSNKGQ